MNDDLLDSFEAAGILNVPPATLNQWRYLGRGPAYFRIGRHIRYSRNDLNAYLKAMRVEPQPAV